MTELPQIMPQQPNPPVQKKEEKKPAGFKTIVPLLLFVAAGLIAGKLIFSLVSSHKKQPAAQKPSASVARKADPSPLAKPFSAVKKKVKGVLEPFSLSGVYVAGEDSYAIINDRILQAGDTIDGAAVSAINEDSVELDAGGKIVILKMKKN